MFRKWHKLALRGGKGKVPPVDTLLVLRLEPKAKGDELRHITASIQHDDEKPNRLMLKEGDGGCVREASRYTKRYTVYWTELPQFDGFMPETY